MNLLALCLFSYKWFIAVPFLIASTTLIGIPLTLVSLLGMGDWGSKTLAVLWAKANSRVLGMGVDIEGLEHLQSDKSYVVVANHWSQLDILLIYGYLPVELKWVMKQELRRVPILGAACAAMGHIIIDRSNTAQAIASIERASKRLVNGMCVVFFPEGTRAPPGEVRHFKKGAFKLAIDLGLPVLPLTLHGTDQMLPTGTLNWRPGSTTLEIHPPIDTQGLSEEDVSNLCRQTESLIQRSISSPIKNDTLGDPHAEQWRT